ncbi:MAG: hypothetical protein HY778_02645 [Betaproteobacteria bacterium]|nr:hypothetical protein [Betaproteobacteria bacterium]
MSGQAAQSRPRRAGWVRMLAGLLAAAGIAWATPVVAAPACVAPAPVAGGIGGTGQPIPSRPTAEIDARAAGGIGGTGAMAAGGIGGTGIVGAITGFASICVNGLEIEFDAATPVSVNGRTARADALALGQVVAVHAGSTARGLVANDIAVVHAMEGPVTAVEGGLKVMDRPVRADAATVLAGVPAVEALRVGQSVRISGFGDVRGELLATRIEAVADLEGASAVGLLARGAQTGMVIDGVAVAGVAAEAAGEAVLVRGRWDGRALVAADRQPDPARAVAQRSGRVVVEGLAHAMPAAGMLVISGFEVQVPEGIAAEGVAMPDLAPGRRIRVQGIPLGPGRIRAERLMPDMPRDGRGATQTNGGHQPGQGRDDRIQRPEGMERRSPLDRPPMMQRMQTSPGGTMMGGSGGTNMGGTNNPQR